MALAVFLLSALIVLCAGCAANYSLRTVQSPVALQWPFAPEKARVTFVQAFDGFRRGAGGASSALRVIAGSREQKSDTFVLPVSVAIGHDGRIAVADMGRSCVHLYVPGQSRYLRLYGGEKSKIVSPVSVIFDDELKLFLSDSAGRVFVFGTDGAFILTLDKAGNDALKRPTGLAFNPLKKWIYVADTSQNKIDTFNTEGRFLFSFGDRGEENGKFNFPTHLCWTPGGLYVTDSMNFRVQRFDESGGFLGSFGHHGDGSGDLAMPKGVVADKNGVIYVVDSLFDNVQLFNSQGEFLLTLGSRGTGPGEFWLPSGMFIDKNDRLYVCDTYNRRIQVFQIREQS